MAYSGKDYAAYTPKKAFYKTTIMLGAGLLLLTFKLTSYFLSSGISVTPKHAVWQHQYGDSMGSARRLLQEDFVLECDDVRDPINVRMKCKASKLCDHGGFFDYYEFIYCLVEHVGAVAFLIVWWIFLFIGLAVTADDFFCPALITISKTLNLTPNVAGVTFLAFGNGGPDFFSSITALTDPESDGELGIGGIFGAGLFVTSVIIGAIAIVKPFRAMARPFLRDIIFYIVAVYWSFLMLWRERVYFFECLAFCGLYVVYVLVVIVSGKIYEKQKRASDGGVGITLTHMVGVVESTGLHHEGMHRQQSMTWTLKEDDEGDAEGDSKELEANGKENKAFNNSSLSFKDEDSLRGDNTYCNTEDNLYDEVESVKEDKNHKPSFTVGNGTSNGYDNMVGDIFKVGSIRSEQEMAEARRMSLDITDMLPGALLRQQGSTRREGTPADPDKRKVYFTALSTEELVEQDLQYLPMWKVFLNGINPINTEDWPTMSLFGKSYEIFKSPIMFLFLLSVPVINYDDEELNNWNRPLNILQCFISPTASVLLVQVHAINLGPVPVYALTLGFGLILATVVFFTSSNYVKPRYHAAFGFFAFFIAVVWIYTLANEIVSLLETFGIVFNISEAILGLTALAWGNSVGDLVANMVMARQGFARMGFAACFGAPFFNLTLGFGLAMMIKMAGEGTTSTVMALSSIQVLMALFLGLILLSSLVLLPLVFQFQVNKPFGIYLFVLYTVFVVTALVMEMGYIDFNI